MANYVLINWNEAAIESLLNDEAGPVGDLLAELSAKVTATAKAGAPVQTASTFSWGKVHSTSYLPRSGGYTKMTTHSKMGYDSQGHLYGGTNAPYGPTIFLEKAGLRKNGTPRTLYPFLSTALYSLEL